MKHFLNRDMLAPNVSTFRVDPTVIESFSDLEGLAGRFSSVAPQHWRSDIEWVSAADEETFAIFQSAFDALGIAIHAKPYLDLDKEVRLYAGFLVVRSGCTDTDFHVDWVETNNEAFTCLMPVSTNARGFGLLYKKLTGEIAEYEYTVGEAIAFGENFEHSTKPGRTEQPITLLCFEYGTDKMEHWPNILRTVGRQVTHLRRPDGRFVTVNSNV